MGYSYWITKVSQKEKGSSYSQQEAGNEDRAGKIQSTVLDDTFALDQQSDREGNSHTGFSFPEKTIFFF